MKMILIKAMVTVLTLCAGRLQTNHIAVLQHISGQDVFLSGMNDFFFSNHQHHKAIRVYG